MAPIPDPEQLAWWQQVIAGALILLIGWLTRAKFKVAPAYVTKEKMEDKMKICQQDILLQINNLFEEREERLIKRIIRAVGK